MMEWFYVEYDGEDARVTKVTTIRRTRTRIIRTRNKTKISILTHA
jgi:hypothetical protein